MDKHPDWMTRPLKLWEKLVGMVFFLIFLAMMFVIVSSVIKLTNPYIIGPLKTFLKG